MTAPVAGLCLASHFGLPVLVQRWLKTGAVIDASDDFGQTPLLYAVKEGHDAVVQQLLDAGAGVDVSGDTGRTPLSYASISRAERRCYSPPNLDFDTVVSRLLDKNANFKAKDDRDRTALTLALKNWATRPLLPCYEQDFRKYRNMCTAFHPAISTEG
ncbi:Ankyrin repeat-containing domain protein [Moelleriella libera RCEF 2490]|uniref:Ankyrin repeat-containing domain protein n=1 Tax=Moelleriella libera RCEF 2490 TaxID=1081109 RepID=A0A167ZMD6_9HYPO|nr:Ankyrin repeat-containing domain protein [Moelleriella libera RCEF 2490]